MQLNRTARHYVDANSAPISEEGPSGLSLRLGELIATLAPSDRQPILEELACAHWAEPALIAALCRLPLPDSARLIRYAPALTERQLTDLIHEGPDEKAVLIAARAALPPATIRALIASGPTSAAVQLLHNPTLRLDPSQFQALSRRAQSEIALRTPLVGHADLPREAAALLLNFVGPHLRDGLMTRFEALCANAFASASPRDLGQSLHRLQQGDFYGFCAGLSQLTAIPEDRVRQALRQDSVVPLALIMTAAGLDRATLADLAAQIQNLNDGHPRISSAHLRFARLVFDLSPAEARARLLDA